MNRLVLLLCALLALAPAAASTPPAADAASSSGVITVAVDPRVELVTIMARLAGYEEYQAPGIAAYDQAVADWFEPYRAHPAIAAMRALRESHGIGYNAPIELALVATPGSWKPRVALSPRPGFLDPRWDEAAARTFLAAAASFERDTDAAGFFASQRHVHAAAEAAVRGNLGERLDVSWYLARMPHRDVAGFQVVPALLAGPNSYGPHLRDLQGRDWIFGVLATPPTPEGADISYPADAQLTLLVHEFHHSYMNPWADEHAAVLLPSAETLYAAVAPRMEALAYGEPQILLYESLVRANTIRYLRAHGEDVALRRVLAEDQGKGFAWTPALADLLEAGGDARFDAGTAARVAALLAEWGRDDGAMVAAEEARLAGEKRLRLAQGPQILAFVPADGSVVAAGDRTLEIHFDRPMSAGVAVFGDVPETTGKLAWDEAKRVLRVPVRLAAGTRVVLYLNNEETAGFRSEEGEALVPREWRFSVE